MAACSTIPPPRVTSRQAQASLRVSALRSSLVCARPTPRYCSTSAPSSTSIVFPSLFRRFARACARVLLPDPIIPVNQTVKPLEVVPFICCRLRARGGCGAHYRPDTFFARKLNGYCGDLPKSGSYRNLFFVEIGLLRVPGIEPRVVHPVLAAGNHQIIDPGPERSRPAAQRHVSVLLGEIGSDVRVGMNDDAQGAAFLLGPGERFEQHLGIHHVAVAADPLARSLRFGRSRDVRDRQEARFSIPIGNHDSTALGRICGAGMGGDLPKHGLGKRGHCGSGRYRSARSGKIVTTTPRSRRPASSLAMTSAPQAAAPALWPASSVSSARSRSAMSHPSSLATDSFRSSSCS